MYVPKKSVLEILFNLRTLTAVHGLVLLLILILAAGAWSATEYVYKPRAPVILSQAQIEQGVCESAAIRAERYKRELIIAFNYHSRDADFYRDSLRTLVASSGRCRGVNLSGVQDKMNE